ncbi:ABC transporter G family member 20-like [Panonychus citri]|uniref:ABC transporter G family member 20-like n=1 Tax=Panonychus citri TaxID=50023 RepID=UPI002307E50C|nr:ABC transporter G family member 20-like [Panonychus citri]XP_053209394.1 ABC transporter G family member 20-like [Panonychus citri]
MIVINEMRDREFTSLPNMDVLEEIKTIDQPVLAILNPRRRLLLDPGVPSAVQVRSVTYTLGSADKIVNILNRTNMTVPLGAIYSLLGPSGCGKTTLLRCVIGCLKPQKGLIRVFGYKPGTKGSFIPGPGIGYMPQDFALYDDLTIEETLIYFGRVYFMHNDLLQQRIDYLIEIMDLPKRGFYIKNLSGGQKRRVSFACSLVHKPKLLLLDEPTVGVDPILRTRIWDVLIHLTENEKMTVIITTHYIEETRRSHMVGFMRRGHILAEDSPSTLIRRYHAKSLEDVFYKLCVAQKRQSKLWKRTSSRKRSGLFSKYPLSPRDWNEPPGIVGGLGQGLGDGLESADELEPETPESGFGPDMALDSSNAHWYTKLDAVTRKILIQSVRQPSAIFAQFILPLVSLFLFCWCVGGTPKLVPIALVNNENPPYLSETYLSHIDKSIISLRNYSSLEEALEGVRANKLLAALHFEHNFSDSLIQRSETNEILSDRVVNDSTIKIYADLTNKILVVTLLRSLNIAVQKFLRDVSSDLGYSSELFTPPIKVESAIFGEYRPGDYFAVRDYGIPGTLIILTYSCAFGLTVMVLTVERARQMFERNFVAGVTTTHIILGHLIARIIFMSISVVILFLVALFIFDVPCNGPFLQGLSLLFLQSVSGLTHGMMISSMCSEFFMAAVISNGMLLTMFILSGALWPVQSLPFWLKKVSLALPVTIPTEALRSILSRGLDLNHQSVMFGFIISIGWSLIFLFSAVILFKKTQKLKD